jgi:hypothetical protein
MSDTPSERWSPEQIMALAPDASSQKAARGLASPGRWTGTGWQPDGEPPSIWGLCAGSGAKPYQTVVDLAEPAYRCSCPSRKFPCKHGLGLLLVWSAGGLAEAEPPDWVAEWHAGRAKRKATRAEAAEVTPEKAEQRRVAAAKTAAKRADRVAGGLSELERWLGDQVRQGLAGLGRQAYGHWDGMAARLVDAQAPSAASAVRRLASVASRPERLLTELALLRLLTAGYERLAELPDELAATVRSRIGFPVTTDEVLARPPVRDEWTVVAVRDEAEDTLRVRRSWLLGAESRRPALILSFAGPGQSLPADLPVGGCVDADVHYYPGGGPLRALVGTRHGPIRPTSAPGGAVPVSAALDAYASALAADPWLERWPVLLDEVAFARADDRWYLRDKSGEALALETYADPPWTLVAAAGGGPATVAGEYGPAGLRPLTAWVDGRLVLA